MFSLRHLPIFKTNLARNRRSDKLNHVLRLEHLEPREMLSWTVMVYMDADDAGDAKLANYIADNFAEMAKAGSTNDVKIVAQIDSIGSPTAFSGHAGAWRGLIHKNDTPSLNWGTSLGNVDSGNPQSVIDFVEWATLNYSSDHYALIFWDHGLGFAGVCSDDTSKSILSMMDVTQAMNTIGHVDLLAFDACMMGMVEVASQFRSEADVLVASEETIPGTGYDYSFLSELVADPNMTAQTLATSIVDTYGDYYTDKKNEKTTLAAIDLTKIGNSSSGLSSALENFANIMVTVGTQKDWNAFTAARNASYRYNYIEKTNSAFPGHDVIQMMTKILATSGISSSVAAAATTVINMVQSCVLEAYHGTEIVGDGLSIFSPMPNDSDLWSDYNCDLSFIGDTQWILVAGELGPRDAPGVVVTRSATDANKYDLSVYGTNASDTFYFKQVSGGRIQIQTSMQGWSRIYSAPKHKYIGNIYIYAWNGNDTITFDASMTYSSIIYCGKGNDRITTRSGQDTIFGGPGNDVIDAGAGNDLISGGDGNDSIYGRIGNDRINGNDGNDTLVAGAGNDTLYGAVGSDTLYGEAGNDILIGGINSDIIRDIGGYNRIFGGLGNDRLYGGNGIDYIYGSLGNDILLGGAGNDLLAGGLGANLLIGGQGIDQVQGRGGNNILIGGTTSYDNVDNALLDIMREWTRSLPRATRIAHLQGTRSGGLNGNTFLRKTGSQATVFSDNLANALFGSQSDWFLSFSNDKIYPPA